MLRQNGNRIRWCVVGTHPWGSDEHVLSWLSAIAISSRQVGDIVGNLVDFVKLFIHLLDLSLEPACRAVFGAATLAIVTSVVVEDHWRKWR